MFGKKSELQKIRDDRALLDSVPKAVDDILKIDDPARRYDLLGALSTDMEMQKKKFDAAHPRSEKDFFQSISLLLGAGPAGLFVADLTLTGGLVTGFSLAAASVYKATLSDKTKNTIRAVNDGYNLQQEIIREEQKKILQQTEPKLLLASEAATKRLRDDPEIKNVFAMAAYRKAVEEQLNPAVLPAKKPGRATPRSF